MSTPPVDDSADDFDADLADLLQPRPINAADLDALDRSLQDAEPTPRARGKATNRGQSPPTRPVPGASSPERRESPPAPELAGSSTGGESAHELQPEPAVPASEARGGLIGLDEFMPDQGPADATPPLTSIRLGEKPAAIVAFLTQFAKVTLHPWVQIDKQYLHVRCNGNPCLLCDLEYPRKVYFINPVYAVADGGVRALVISDANEPHSLGPQFKAELMAGRLDTRYLFITRVGMKYTLRSRVASPGAELGDREIKKFLEALKEGRVRLADAIPVYSNEYLFDIDSFRRDAEAAGFERSRYSPAAKDSAGSGPP